MFGKEAVHNTSLLLFAPVLLKVPWLWGQAGFAAFLSLMYFTDFTDFMPGS